MDKKCKKCFAYDEEFGDLCKSPLCIKDYNYDPETRIWTPKRMKTIKEKIVKFIIMLKRKIMPLVSKEKIDGKEDSNMDCLVVGENGGKKCDDGKREMDLLFDAPEALEMIVDVLEYGKKKYGRCNWKDVDIERYRNALQRHYIQIKKGNLWDDDPKTGTGALHWANIACCALFSLQITIDELKKKNEFNYKVRKG